MALIQDIFPKDTFLHVLVRGSFNLHEAKQAFSKVLLAVAETGISGVLIDYRAVIGLPSQSERFEYVTSVCEQVSRAVAAQRIIAIKLAYLGQGEAPEDLRFAERLAHQRGLNVHSAESLESGVQWLERSSDSRLRPHEHLPDQAPD